MARFTPDDLARITARHHYAVKDNAVARRIPDPLPQHDVKQESVGADENEGRGAGFIIVRITRHGSKLLDKDNLYGGVKYICDALRHEGIIPDDNPEAIDLQVLQKKVPRQKVGTLIEIEYT